MAKSVVLTTTVTITGDGYGGQGAFYSSTQTNATGLPPGQVVTANGSVTQAIPATALGVVIVPPAGSALIKTYKGIAGDTGIPTSATGVVVFTWTAAQLANFVITTTGIETIELIWL